MNDDIPYKLQPNNFMERFQGKANRVPKHGINALFSKQEPETFESLEHL